MIRCLVADASPASRALLRAILARAPEIAVVGEAADGAEAVRQVEALRPDVVTMDLGLRGIGGLAAIEEIMRRRPTPVVVVAAAGADGQRTAFAALQAGAVEVLTRPAGDGLHGSERDADAIHMAVRSVAGLTLVTRHAREARQGPAAADACRHGGAPAGPPAVRAMTAPGVIRAVGIAASTGGPGALARILRELPTSFPAPILVVQHIAAGFEDGLVAWLSGETTLPVKLAAAREPLRPGAVYVAPAGAHLGALAGRVRLDDGPPVRGFRPSGTALFRSLAREYGPAAGGLVLSGMGDDGAEGLADLRASGGWTAAQGPRTSVVHGMPRVAAERGAAALTLELEDIAAALVRLCPCAP